MKTKTERGYHDGETAVWSKFLLFPKTLPLSSNPTKVQTRWLESASIVFEAYAILGDEHWKPIAWAD